MIVIVPFRNHLQFSELSQFSQPLNPNSFEFCVFWWDVVGWCSDGCASGSDAATALHVLQHSVYKQFLRKFRNMDFLGHVSQRCIPYPPRTLTIIL